MAYTVADITNNTTVTCTTTATRNTILTYATNTIHNTVYNIRFTYTWYLKTHGCTNAWWLRG